MSDHPPTPKRQLPLATNFNEKTALFVARAYRGLLSDAGMRVDYAKKLFELKRAIDRVREVGADSELHSLPPVTGFWSPRPPSPQAIREAANVFETVLFVLANPLWFELNKLLGEERAKRATDW